MDRPSRKTKVVNYCESKDFDDDEDFACSKAPPSKKVKEVVRPEQRSTSKSLSQETNSQLIQSEKIRKRLDEKLYERDLEAAITLSLLNNTDGLKDTPNCEDVKDENTDPAFLHLSNCSVDAVVLGLDRITSERSSLASSGKAKAAEVQGTNDEDEYYQPKLTPDLESDEDYSVPAESDEEEFTVKKVSKTKKQEKATKKDKTKPTPASTKTKQPSSCKPQTSVSTSVRTPPSVKSGLPRPASSSTASASKPAASLSPAGGRIPKWTPPAQIGKSPMSSQTPAGKSPGPSPGLRLGLSRLVRVKPLHPSVTSH